MRLARVAAILLLGISAVDARPMAEVNQSRNVDPRDLHHCNLRAVQPADNDIRSDDAHGLKVRSITLPAPVSRAILDHVSEVAKKQFTREDWAKWKHSCSDIFSAVSKLAGPNGLQIYVAPRYFPLENSVDYLVAYDPSSAAVTKSPPLIFTKWWDAFDANDPLVKRPIVRMEPARGSWPPLLIAEERTHNGNVYDAAVYRYFEIGRNMSLTQVLAVEARAILFSDPKKFTERKVTFLTANRVRLDVSSRSRKWGAQGSALLERTRSGQPFHVARRTPARGTKTDGLITYCDSAKGDDDFLRVGCDFYY